MNDARWQEIINKYKLSPMFTYGLEQFLYSSKKSGMSNDDYEEMLSILDKCLEETKADYTSNDKQELVMFYTEFSVRLLKNQRLKEVLLQALNTNENKGLQLSSSVPQRIEDKENDNKENRIDSCVVITELNYKYFTVGFSNKFSLKEVGLYGNSVECLYNPIFFRFSFSNLDTSLYYPQYVIQREKDGIYWLEDHRGHVFPWPNIMPCHFCITDYTQIKEHINTYGLDDAIFYRDFLFGLFLERGLLKSSSYSAFIDGEMYDIPDDKQLCKEIYELNKFYYLEEYLSGKELLNIRGVGDTIHSLLLKNGFRIVNDLLEREDELKGLLGDRRAQRILDEIKQMKSS